MGHNQSEAKIINILNKQQTTYFVKSEISRKSDVIHFLGIKRINGDIQVMHDDENCYILKILPYDTEENIKNFKYQQDILNLFKNDPQILKNEDPIEMTIELKKCIVVPTKYCHQGDTYYYLWHLDNISVDIVRMVSFQALQILNLLKEKHVIHNDIKLENFFVQSINPLKIILNDFKYAQILNENEKSNHPGGTPIYESPEMLEKKDHDYSSDIWSLGVNIYLALFAELPFGIIPEDNESVILNKIKNNELVNKENKIPPDAWECLTKMLELNPDNRITAHDALDLDWFLPEINKANGI